MSAFECTCSTCMHMISYDHIVTSIFNMMTLVHHLFWRPKTQRQPNATHSAFDCSCVTSGSTSENSQLRPQTAKAAKVQHPSIVHQIHQYPQSSQSEFYEKINLNYRLSWLELDPVDIVESSEYLSFHLQ